MMGWKTMCAALAVLAGIALGMTACAADLTPVAPPGRAAFPPEAIARGAALAALGDCVVCHTARDGAPFAGGRKVPTPFGPVLATNITPDPETGIGTWSLAAFTRAMREGIGRDGAHLYPVLPYPHFTRASDDDIAALYAFVMTRRPVRHEREANGLAFPFAWRPLLAGWNALFLRTGAWQPDPAKDKIWNRGAYLVEAIGHCAACHAPHNALGAETGGGALTGGDVEGWHAPALGPNSPAPVAWTEAQLTEYLRSGLDRAHGAAGGPMAAVTEQLAAVPEEDVRAMAVYIASQMPERAAARPAVPVGEPDPAAAAIFAGACGGCHGSDRANLAVSTSVHAPTARGTVSAILHGLPFREGRSGPYMPAFAEALTDAQVEALADYVRGRFGGLPAWTDTRAAIAGARTEGGG